MELLGKYILDSFQFFFPPSTGIQAYLKKYCQGSKNYKKNCLPLICSENFFSTRGTSRAACPEVLGPQHFGHNASELNWSFDGKAYTIPSEQTEMEVFIQPPFLKFIILTQKQGRQQYHIEFSRPGNLFAPRSLAALYLKYVDFQDLLSRLQPYGESARRTAGENFIDLLAEEKDGLQYTVTLMHDYFFNLLNFLYLKLFLEQNNLKANPASLIFSFEGAEKENQEPCLLQFVKIQRSPSGERLRHPQIVFMISRPRPLAPKERHS